MLDNLIILRNILYRYTAIAFVFFIISFIAYMIGKDYFLPAYSSMFGVSKSEFNAIALNSFAEIKLLIIFLALLPGIVIHWTINKIKKGQK